jgi:N-acetylmuramic acid 6-phosphate etherase
MIDVQATNAKLALRSARMLGHLTGRNTADVQQALRASDGNVKLAMLLLKGCSLEEAKHLLDRTQGRLRTALALLG